MKIKVPFTWKEALSCTFNQDLVRRQGVRFRSKQLSCFVGKEPEGGARECKEWIVDSKVTQFEVYGLFDARVDQVYYLGLVFEFKNENDALFFKLRFN